MPISHLVKKSQNFTTRHIPSTSMISNLVQNYFSLLISFSFSMRIRSVISTPVSTQPSKNRLIHSLPMTLPSYLRKGMPNRLEPYSLALTMWMNQQRESPSLTVISSLRSSGRTVRQMRVRPGMNSEQVIFILSRSRMLQLWKVRQLRVTLPTIWWKLDTGSRIMMGPPKMQVSRLSSARFSVQPRARHFSQEQPSPQPTLHAISTAGTCIDYINQHHHLTKLSLVHPIRQYQNFYWPIPAFYCPIPAPNKYLLLFNTKLQTNTLQPLSHDFIPSNLPKIALSGLVEFNQRLQQG